MNELIPIYRVEFFLDAIVNGGENPYEPMSPVEKYLARIAGADLQIPVPISRADHYLAKLCGEAVELPAPVSRIDHYLAAICGKDVEVPDPVYRIEFWLNAWASGGSGTLTTVTGVSPLALVNALAKPIRSLTQYGKCTQSGTPTPDNPAPILCNNGEIKARHQSGLPTGYTLLDYVSNASGTRIDTGIYDDVDDFRIEMRVRPSLKSWYICQSRKNTNTPIYGISGVATGSKISISNGGLASAISGISRDDTHIYTVIGEHKNGSIFLYVKDETTGVEDTQTNTYSTESFEAAPTPIGVWGTGANTVNEGNAIYYLRIYKGGALVADYLPCQYNGENGFYDFVTEAFIGKTIGTINAGTAVNDPVIVYTDGTPEVLTISADGAEAQTVTNISMLLSAGDYKDEAEINSGLLTHKVGVLILDGTEAWTEYASGDHVYFADLDIDATFSLPSDCLCTHYQGFSSTIGASGLPKNSIKCGFRTDEQYNRRVYFRDTSLATVADVSSFLAAQYAAGTPVIVLYSLATETTEQGTAHSLHTSAGDNTVTVTSEVDPVELEVEYTAASA